MAEKIDKVLDVLAANAKVPFVRRILSPKDAPAPIKDEETDEVMTHKMSYGEEDGKFYVFPEVMEDQDGTLRNYGEGAFEEAMRRGDAIQFNTAEEADWFTKNYKLYWDKIGYRP